MLSQSLSVSVCVLLQGYGGHTGLGGLPSSLSASTSNLSTASSGTSSSQQGGRRPIIIRDAQQRAMLQNIRDSLAHLQKPNSLPSPGSDHSGMCSLLQKTLLLTLATCGDMSPFTLPLLHYVGGL